MTSSSSSATGGSISCSGAVALVALAPGSMPHGLFADGTNVYWTNSGTGEVMQVKTDGTDQVTLAQGEDTPIAVEVANGFVYWVSASMGSVLRRVPVGGGVVTERAQLSGFTFAVSSRDLVRAKRRWEQC